MKVEQEENGLTVSSVLANSSAARAGLRSGDVILDDKDQPVQKRSSLSKLLASYEPGDWFLLNALRAGEPVTFEVRVAATWSSLMDRQAMMNRFGSDVSYRRSGFNSVLQHDTLMHPSDCGGPLVNLQGELIGVNIARAGRTDTYAIPIEEVYQSLKELQDQIKER